MVLKFVLDHNQMVQIILKFNLVFNSIKIHYGCKVSIQIFVKFIIISYETFKCL